jgi:hypothetical protein
MMLIAWATLATLAGSLASSRGGGQSKEDEQAERARLAKLERQRRLLEQQEENIRLMRPKWPSR